MFFIQIELKNWLLIYPKIDHDRAVIYVNMLRQVAQQQGMIINEPIYIQMEDDEVETTDHIQANASPSGIALSSNLAVLAA